MKVLSTEGLTKLIQLIKSSFIKKEDVEETTEIDLEEVNEVELATVASSGSYNDLSDKPTAVDLSDYYTKSEVDGKGYLTSHQSLSDYYTKSEVDNSGYLKNTATGDKSLTVGGGATGAEQSVNIGINSYSTNSYSIAVGHNIEAGWRSITIGTHILNRGTQCIAIGGPDININSGVQKSIVIAPAVADLFEHTDSYSFYVGFDSVRPLTHLYKLLDGETGLIPDDRISSNIARVSDIPSGGSSYTAGTGINITNDTISAVIDSELSSTSTNPVQNKVIYAMIEDKLGDIETALSTINQGGVVV